ncbi:MAG TPA: NUDIX hydrolase [Streptosporangiaceae bacterium]|jgi:ADP-ribose pyrophosphatase
MAELRDEKADWPVAGSVVLARARIVTLKQDDVQLPDGELVVREVVEHPGAVAIVAIDEADRVLMIRQYRHPVRSMLWELPAGLRDVPGEPPLETARRELLEEAGYQAGDWHELADYLSSPGISTEQVRVYLARNLTVVPAGQHEYVRQHEEAYLTVAWVPLAEAVRAVLAGDLRNGVAIVGILSAYAAHTAGFRALHPAGEPQGQ